MNYAQIPPIDSTSLNAIIQLGAIGVLLLLGISLVLYIARRPNQSAAADPSIGTNAAINALAQAITDSNNRLDDTLKAQKEKDVADRAQIKDQNERYIESISAQADATNSLVDVLKKQGSDSTALKEDIHTMTTQGSKPLNDLIGKFDALQSDVQAIKTNNDSDHAAIDVILHDIAEMKAIVIRIDQRRATSENGKVTLDLPSPLQVEVTNQATG